jgi:hypothetical protein
LHENALVTIELRIEGLRPTDRAHQVAAQDFVEYVRETRGVQLSKTRADGLAGIKGGLDQIALELASPATVTGLVAVLRLWLRRDRKRSVHVKVTSDTQTVEAEASGEGISLDALKSALETALKTTQVNPSGDSSS